MLVECYDEKGAEVYEMIIKQIFQDLVLGPAVEDLKAFANPDEAVFILAIKMKKTSGVINLVMWLTSLMIKIIMLLRYLLKMRIIFQIF